MKEDKLVCHHLEHGLYISPQKEYKPCCIYKNSLASNFTDYQNSSELSRVKSDFEQGIRSAECQECWDDESAGHQSKRTIDLEHVFNHREPESGLSVIMVAFGNSCNLACRTCGSYCSTTWIKEEKVLAEQGKTVKIYPHHRFYQDNGFIEELKDISKNVKHVYFMGGETFLAGVNEHLNYLEYLKDLGADDIHLHYTTNSTILPNKQFKELWKDFKKVDIQLSIDGLEQHFEYTRWPAKWSLVLNIIKDYQQYASKASNVKLTVGYVVSIFTVYYYPEFYKWCLQNNLKDPFISLLSFPAYYDIRSLPTAVKDKISEKLSKYHFDEIINYMYQQDLSEHFAIGKEYIASLDQQRNQSFENTFPEFYQLLKDCYETTAR